MDSNRSKNAADWFYNKVFGEESIRPRFYEPEPLPPSLLRAARSLEIGKTLSWGNRALLFVQQGKLLAGFEDDYVYERPVQHFFPTYQTLSDPELRGYFTWRTGLRQGKLEQTHLTYAFLYIYELINLIGVENPEEGYRKLVTFREEYGSLDRRILPYLNRWITDFTVCYRLEPQLLKETGPVRYHNCVAVLENLKGSTDEQILDMLSVLAPSWLKRSRFYRDHKADMDTVLVGVLRGMEAHYASGKRPLAEHACGRRTVSPVRLFESAVYHNRQRQLNCVYRPDASRIFRCKNGVWTVEKYGYSEQPSQYLEMITKTVDAILRRLWGDKHPIQCETEVKWVTKLIEAEGQRLLEEKQAKEAAEKRVRIDFSRLDAIRRDAAITRDKLIVEEEMEEELPDTLPASQPEADNGKETAGEVPGGLPLSPPQYRLLRDLLYGGSLDWVRREGLMLSVLTDGINEALYDMFCDTVLTSDEPPEVIEDYIDELKETVTP